MRMTRSLLLVVLLTTTVTGCTVLRKARPTRIPSAEGLHLLGAWERDAGTMFQGTYVGGLSGIDYDSARNCYYLICDDRSERNPARYYTAAIHFSMAGIDSVQWLRVDSLRQPDGSLFPFKHTDPEAIRYNPLTDELVWTSEGERTLTDKRTALQDPTIRIMNRDGRYLDSFPIPANVRVHSTENGMRDNGVFEGLSFTPDYKEMFVSIEEPLYEDGPRAGGGDSTGWIRILRYNVADRKLLAQYAYQIDPVAHPANPPGAFKVNGIPDILHLGNNVMLVMERSFSTGKPACTIRIYLADLTRATDVSSIQSLSNKKSIFRPVQKKLLLNMDSLNRYIDNVEGMTIGPKLSNGNPSLIMVADENFSKQEKMQFFLFEVK
jgi:hypothetical protein